MPRRCIAAGCSTSTGEGYSLHEFPRDDSTRAKWTRAVKRFGGIGMDLRRAQCFAPSTLNLNAS